MELLTLVLHMAVTPKNGALSSGSFPDEAASRASASRAAALRTVPETVKEREGGFRLSAREYGLPCVAGAPNATSFIKTGDSLVVDGFLGIVTLEDRSA